MEIEVKHDIQANYLVIHSEADKPYMVEMLAGNKVKGFLELEVRVMDNQNQYYYDITGKENIVQKTQRGKWSKKELVSAVSQILDTIKKAREYLLAADHFLLEPEYIYRNIDTGELSLCYTWERDKSINEQLTELFAYFLNAVDYEEQEAVEWIYCLYDTSREEECTLQRLWSVFEVEEEKIEKQETVVEEIVEKKPAFKEKLAGQTYEKKEVTLGGFFRKLRKSGDAKEKPEKKLKPQMIKEKPVKKLTPQMVKEKPAKKLTPQTVKEKPVKKLTPQMVKEKPAKKLTPQTVKEKPVKKLTPQIAKEEPEKKWTPEGVREKAEKKPIFKRQPENRRANSVPADQAGWTESKKWELESDDKTQITDPDQTVYRPELAKSLKENRRPLCYLVPKQETDPVIAICELPFYIGRFQKDTDVLKGMHSISRIHCKIEKDDALFYLSDLSSTNGTYHNSTKLTQGKKVVLQEGDLIDIADVTYRFAFERP